MTTTPAATAAWGLTAREFEVLQLIAADTTDAEVAEHLDVSAETVRSHMKSIRVKLGVASRTGAVVKALRAGVIA